MPIKFISLNNTFLEKIKEHGYNTSYSKIEDYIPVLFRKTYYVSPANSLCFMDGGIDYVLSRIIFPDIEIKVKERVKQLKIKNILGRHYLPIGSSTILDIDDTRSLIVSPTMLLPQNVSTTNNAYISTMSILYNILENRKENIDDIDILFTSLCCGYGKLDEAESVSQIITGIKNYKSYKPDIIDNNTIINEPTLHKQPKYYQNTEWFDIPPHDIIQVK